MKKTLLSLLCAGAMALPGNATVYEYTFAKNDITTAGGTKTYNDVEWSMTAADAIGWDNNASAKGIQIGTGTKPAHDWAISTSAFSNITGVVVNSSTANSATATLTVSVGGVNLSPESQALTTTATDYSFRASSAATGELKINLLQPSTSKALYIKSIKVYYDNEQMPDDHVFEPTGAGTETDPYTVADVIGLNNSKSETAWVKGYIVGYYVNNAVSLGVVTATSTPTNLALASDASETDGANCIPVQLPSGSSVQTALSPANSENIGKEVSVYGDLTAYFSVPGVKNTSDYLPKDESAQTNVADIASFLAAGAADNTKSYVITGTVTTVYQNGLNLYIQDASGALLVYGALDQQYSPGTALTGIEGKYSPYNGQPQMSPSKATFTEGTAGTAPTPAATNVAAITSASASKYVKLSGVTVAESDGDFTITEGTSSISLYNKFSQKIYPGENIDVVGVVNIYNDVLQIIPTETVGTEPTVDPIPDDCEEYTYEFTSNVFGSSLSEASTFTLGAIEWTLDPASYFGYDSTKGVQIGKAAGPITTWTIKTDAFTDAEIYRVELNASTGSGATISAAATIAGSAMNPASYNLIKDPADYLFGAQGTKGELVLTFTQTGTSKALYIKSIKVYYKGQLKTPDEPAVTEVDDIAAWLDEANTTTDITITGDVTVVYQNGKYLYVQDATGSLLVYGSLTNKYSAGDVLSGIKGKYSTYSGMIQFAPVDESFGDATSGDAPAPATVKVTDVTTDMMAKYVKFEGVTVSAIEGDDRNFTMTQDGAEITIRNQFNYTVTVTTGENLTVVAVLNNYNGTMQVYPIENVGGTTPPPTDDPEVTEEPTEFLSVADVLAMSADDTQADSWVKGYIVGWADVSESPYTVNEATAFFTAPATASTNMLIAPAADCTDWMECVAVQLPAGTLRERLNLQDNEANLGKGIYVYGNVEKYCGVHGVKSTSKYCWFIDDPDDSITGVQAEADAPARWFDLQGREVTDPATGIYIRVQGTTATKVLVK